MATQIDLIDKIIYFIKELDDVFDNLIFFEYGLFK